MCVGTVGINIARLGTEWTCLDDWQWSTMATLVQYGKRLLDGLALLSVLPVCTPAPLIFGEAPSW